jgi:adenine-specific DNA-methyltransferase
MEKSKSLGQVYTPKHIVNVILNEVNYYGKSIIKKHIIDNSCGDGAFLIEIVKINISLFKEKKITLKILEDQLNNYIHGIELDDMEYDKVINNLDNCLKENNINLKIK